MHDLDRTTLYEQDSDYAEEYDNDQEFDDLYDETFEYDDEFNHEIYDDYEYADDEDEELALATELLDLESDEELNEFLGSIFKRVAKKVKSVAKKIRGRRGRSRKKRLRWRRFGRGMKKLYGMHRKVSKIAIPIVGRILGAKYGGPMGARLGGAAGDMIAKNGLFLEGMSPEDQQLEIARRYVRASKDAAQQILTADPRLSDRTIIKSAIKRSRRHFPNQWQKRPWLGKQLRRNGQWYRKGRKIILTGIQ